MIGRDGWAKVKRKQKVTLHNFVTLDTLSRHVQIHSTPGLRPEKLKRLVNLHDMNNTKGKANSARDIP